MQIAQKLRLLMDGEGLLEGNLAKKTGVPQPTINRILHGKIVSPRYETIKKLEAYFRQSLSDPEDNKLVEIKERSDNKVPLITWTQVMHYMAGHDVKVGDWIVCPAEHSEATFALAQYGDSMEPEFLDKHILFVDPKEPFEHNKEIVAYIKNKDFVTCRQLQKTPEGAFIRPLNREKRGEQIAVDENVLLIGVVICAVNFRKKPKLSIM